MTSIHAIEFFSGIGAFAEAAKPYGIKVLAAFDQSSHANSVYILNHKLQPRARNLDAIRASDIEPADIWWLSPPCQPYSVRGNARDSFDARAQSLARLIDLLPHVTPKLLLLENVLGFADSKMHTRLLAACKTAGLDVIFQTQLCPTMFGLPMRRPRFFIAAAKDKEWFDSRRLQKPCTARAPLALYLETNPPDNLDVPDHIIERYGSSLHIIEPVDKDAVAICFTSGYGRCMKASGSFLRTARGTIRRFSPGEQLALFGFPGGFSFPDAIDVKAQWRLIGNSVDVRAIKHLLSACPALGVVDLLSCQPTNN